MLKHEIKITKKNSKALKTVKARFSQKQVHMIQLFSSHCYAALHLFKEMKLQVRNLTSFLFVFTLFWPRPLLLVNKHRWLMMWC